MTHEAKCRNLSIIFANPGYTPANSGFISGKYGR